MVSSSATCEFSVSNFRFSPYSTRISSGVEASTAVRKDCSDGCKGCGCCCSASALSPSCDPLLLGEPPVHMVILYFPNYFLWKRILANHFVLLACKDKYIDILAYSIDSSTNTSLKASMRLWVHSIIASIDKREYCNRCPNLPRVLVANKEKCILNIVKLHLISFQHLCENVRLGSGRLATFVRLCIRLMVASTSCVRVCILALCGCGIGAPLLRLLLRLRFLHSYSIN